MAADPSSREDLSPDEMSEIIQSALPSAAAAAPSSMEDLAPDLSEIVQYTLTSTAAAPSSREDLASDAVIVQCTLPAAAAPPSMEDDLAPDEMSEIIQCVLSEEDRAHMEVVCRSRRAALADLPAPPPALPLLLLPSSGLTRVLRVLSDGSHQKHQYHDRVGVRYFGSCDDGFLFLASHQSRLHRLVDLQREGMRILPDVVCPRYDPSVKNVHDMVILAASLSSPPDDPGCVAAGIVTYQRDDDGLRQRRRCAFWRMGDPVAYDAMAPTRNDALEDVVYQNNFFNFLTDEEHILACSPAFYQEEDDRLQGVSLWAKLRCFEPRDRRGEGFVRARYLVVSRGGLLMVVRFAPDPESPTSAFKLFSAVGPRVLDDDGTGALVWYPYSWSELDTLGGRMLFVGRGCSRSYETADYPGFKDGIYFSDDRSFYDEEMMFRDLNERQYPCSDIGKWTQGPHPNVERFFPEEDRLSNHSSPAWLLP